MLALMLVIFFHLYVLLWCDVNLSLSYLPGPVPPPSFPRSLPPPFPPSQAKLKITSVSYNAVITALYREEKPVSSNVANTGGRIVLVIFST